MKVGQEEEALVLLCATACGCLSAVRILHLVLHAHPVADRAQVIAEVEIARGLDAGDYTHDDLTELSSW